MNVKGRRRQYESDDDDDDVEIDVVNIDCSSSAKKRAPLRPVCALSQLTCGALVGYMKTSEFICPGIHVNCILSENQLLTPKEFVVVAMKDRQKDWKSAIRINGKSSLRTHMEAGTIDFFQHENKCSGMCRSRNRLSYELDENTQRKKLEKRDALTAEILQCRSGEKPKPPEWAYKRGRPPTRTPRTKLSAKSAQSIVTAMNKNSVSFWAEMHRRGHLVDALDNVIICALQLKQNVDASTQPLPDDVSVKLTKLTTAFDRGDAFVKFVQSIERDYKDWKRQNEGKEEDNAAEMPIVTKAEPNFGAENLETMDPEQLDLLFVPNSVKKEA